MEQLTPEQIKTIADAIDEDAYCDNIAKSGTEHAEQRAFFAWLQLMANRQTYTRTHMAYAVPNGGNRDPVTAARLKAEGVKSGVPDICWPVPCGQYAGLYIELKVVKGGNISDNQHTWRKELRMNGYAAAVCRGWRAARQCFVEYVSCTHVIVEDYR